ncbi:hypothetical protein D3C72_2547020 [compost metagenome]
MMRISEAVPAVPSTKMGTQAWVTKSHSLASDQGAFSNSGEKRPPTETPNHMVVM